MSTLETSHTVLQSFIIPIIERTLICLPAVVIMAIGILLERCLFELEHELRECLIDSGLVFVIVIEDELGKL